MPLLTLNEKDHTVTTFGVDHPPADIFSKTERYIVLKVPGHYQQGVAYSDQTVYVPVKFQVFRIIQETVDVESKILLVERIVEFSSKPQLKEVTI